MEKAKEILSKSIEFIRTTVIDFDMWIEAQDPYTCFMVGFFAGFVLSKLF